MTVTTDAPTTFKYGRTRLKDMRPTGTWSRKGGTGTIEVGDEGHAHTGKRFWASLENRFRFSRQIFKYFSPPEVFDRIAKTVPNDEVRYCIEEKHHNGGVRQTLLAVTSPNATVIPYLDLVGAMMSEGGTNLSYANGILASSHQPRGAGGSFSIGPDLFENRFYMATPVDGWGPPSSYIGMMRLLCSNGMIGFAKAFRTETKLSPKDADALHTLRRFVESFNNVDGFSALHQRYDRAQQSWASVREAQKVYRTLLSLADRGDLTVTEIEPVTVHNADGSEVMQMKRTNAPVFRAFNACVGNMHEYYGVASMEALSTKKQRVLPVQCTMYDLLNFLSETATHGATEGGSRALQAVIGDFIGDPAGYDLEGTKAQVAEFADFLIQDKNAALARQMLRQGLLGGDPTGGSAE